MAVPLLTIGFLALISSMILFLASSTEKKFYQILSQIYGMWHEERRRLEIGTEEYRRRMESVEKLLPDTKTLRRLTNTALIAIVCGIGIYSYTLISIYKNWLSAQYMLYPLIFSAFLFIFGGFSSYYANKKITDSMQRISRLLKGLKEE